MDVTIDAPCSLTDLGLQSEEQLGALLTQLAGADPAPPDRIELTIGEVPYDIPALTTRARYRVRGRVASGSTVRAVSAFVKVVQSWGSTPEFQFVPPEFRAAALTQLPWAVEPLVYGSGLAQALPAGLRMPRTYAVLDVDADSAAIWMEDVEVRPESSPAWTIAEHANAAHGLGAFAASASVAAVLQVIEPQIAGLSLRSYAEGRVRLRLAPLLRSDHVWAHPGVDTHFAGLRDRVLTLLDRLPAMLDELDTLPQGLCHGDACTRNLLRSPSGGPLTMIDFGFVRHAPLGLDLGQLVLGEIQLGERSPADLNELWSRCSEAYLIGLRSVGCTADPIAVLRGAALSTAVFSGTSAVPVEELDRWHSPSGPEFFESRAAVARFVLDLLDATPPVRPPAPSPSPAAAW